MHLMVLGASRHLFDSRLYADYRVSMHLMVLGASRRRLEYSLSALTKVSMHLMVLGASRLPEGHNIHSDER